MTLLFTDDNLIIWVIIFLLYHNGKLLICRKFHMNQYCIFKNIMTDFSDVSTWVVTGRKMFTKSKVWIRMNVWTIRFVYIWWCHYLSHQYYVLWVNGERTIIFSKLLQIISLFELSARTRMFTTNKPSLWWCHNMSHPQKDPHTMMSSCESSTIITLNCRWYHNLSHRHLV